VRPPASPSSSPPTTPISISITTRAAAHLGSSSAAICRFSASGTAEPSHMCDWNSGSSPRLTRSAEISTSGRMKPSSLSLGQWSVCNAMLTGYLAATVLAK
jgi:hypothetical protein